MLYLTLVISAYTIRRHGVKNDELGFDVTKLNPASFTLIALEEPENSLSPYYLGRIASSLQTISSNDDVQTLIATHAPSMLRRVSPENIRYLRLSPERKSMVSTIKLPEQPNEAHKFVREAVQAFPEIYFSRLVILGEGASEQIVLPKILEANGLAVDEYAITVAPLGGRHVNHFWRLLKNLGIPHITLLDLDLGRHQGGLGRLKYALSQLKVYANKAEIGKVVESVDKLNHFDQLGGDNDGNQKRNMLENCACTFETCNVFFSFPLDLDFAMLLAYPQAYGAKRISVDEQLDTQDILGKNTQAKFFYSPEELTYFESYKRIFKNNSKPASHLTALSNLDGLLKEKTLPASLARLVNAVRIQIENLPE